jgi:tetratricopeptide (TPR) repeat protein
LHLLTRHPRLASLGFALVLVGAGAAGVFFWAQHHWRAAHRALDRYAFAEAQYHLDLCLKVPFRGAEVHLLAAQAARRRDAYDEAERHLSACLQSEEMTEAAARERLLLTAQQGDLGDMETLLQAHTASNGPEAVLVLEALAKGYMNRFWQADALACLDRLLERQPQHPQAWLLRARLWEDRARKGETEREADTLRDYERAVELDPSFEARLGLAGALYANGRPWQAAAEYERLRGEQAAHPEVLLGLARCRYSLHEVEEARRLLDALLARHPREAAVLLERGRLALHAGQLAEAEGWLRQAAEAAPRYDCQAQRVLCRCLEAEHRDEEARRCFDQLREREASALDVDRRILQANRDPHDVALRYAIALDLMRLGRETDGVAALFLVLEQQPRHGPAHAALAEYFERVGQPGRAARHRRAASAAADTPGAR